MKSITPQIRSSAKALVDALQVVRVVDERVQMMLKNCLQRGIDVVGIAGSLVYYASKEDMKDGRLSCHVFAYVDQQLVRNGQPVTQAAFVGDCAETMRLFLADEPACCEVCGCSMFRVRFEATPLDPISFETHEEHERGRTTTMTKKLSKTLAPNGESVFLRKGDVLPWTIASFLTATVFTADRSYIVQLHGHRGGWVVLALEGPGRDAVPVAESDENVRVEHAAEAIFADHAHKVVGQARTIAEAVAMAENFLRERLGSDVSLDPCDCGEIGAPA